MWWYMFWGDFSSCCVHWGVLENRGSVRKTRHEAFAEVMGLGQGWWWWGWLGNFTATRLCWGDSSPSLRLVLDIVHAIQILPSLVAWFLQSLAPDLDKEHLDMPASWKCRQWNNYHFSANSPVVTNVHSFVQQRYNENFRRLYCWITQEGEFWSQNDWYLPNDLRKWSNFFEFLFFSL